MTPEQLDRLIDDYLDGRLAPEQRDGFEIDLLADPAKLDRLIAAAAVHQLLQDRYAAESQDGLHTLIDTMGAGVADPDGSSVMEMVVEQALAERRKHELEVEAGRMLAAQQAEHARENRYRLLRAKGADANEPFVVSKLAVVLAAAAMLGVIAWLGWPDEQPAQRTTETGQAERSRFEGLPRTLITQAPTVAAIRSSLDASWTGLGIGRDGGLVEGKAITLNEGLAEVVFEDGAAIIVQAPATFEPTGPNGMRMASGKITATIPESAKGFTVDTPGGLITDYGTEFGVHVNHDGQTLAQTFTGRIGLIPADGGAEVDLVVGDAVVANTYGRVRKVEPDVLAFVRHEEYTVRQVVTTEAAVDPYQRWLSYSYDLRRDPDVLIYYSFDATDVSGQTLHNAAGGRRSQQYDARFTAASSALGRFGQQTSFSFEGDGDYVETTLDREMDAVTLAGWFWIDEMAGKFTALLHTSDTSSSNNSTRGIHWHINANHGDAWSIEFVHQRLRNPRLDYWYDSLSSGWSPRSLTGRWVHLALCYDTTTGDAWLYVDGQEATHSRVEQLAPVRLGHFRLGNWYASPQRRGLDWPRPLRGRIDEFVVIERALSGDEVAAMYEAGRPDN